MNRKAGEKSAATTPNDAACNHDSQETMDESVPKEIPSEQQQPTVPDGPTVSPPCEAPMPVTPSSAPGTKTLVSSESFQSVDHFTAPGSSPSGSTTTSSSSSSGVYVSSVLQSLAKDGAISRQVPPYTWAQSKSGDIRLNRECLLYLSLDVDASTSDVL